LCCKCCYKQNRPDYRRTQCRSRTFQSQQYSCSRLPGQCSRGLAQPPPEVRQREAEWRGVARSSLHRNIPGLSRKFGCRTDQHWFGNNRPNVVSHLHPEDYRWLHSIEPGSALVSFPMCRCVSGPPPKFPGNEEGQPNSHREPCVPGPTLPRSGSSNCLDLRRQNQIECHSARATVWSLGFESDTNVSHPDFRSRLPLQSCRLQCYEPSRESIRR